LHLKANLTFRISVAPQCCDV